MKINDIYSWIDAGDPVLTPNRRLARRLRLETAQRRLAAGSGAWATPQVMTWSAWLRRTWNDPATGVRPALLSATQAATLWEEAVAGDREALLLPGGAAATAAEAWALLHAWRLDLDHPAFDVDADGRAFRRWATAYRARCARDGWIDDARLPDRLAAEFAAGRLPLPTRLVLHAFDEPTPQQQALLDALVAAGVETVHCAPSPRGAEPVRTVLPTFADELHHAASWARAALLAEPGLRVGIVVPDLAASRARVVHTLDVVLAPSRLRVDGPEAPRPYEVSLGVPLADAPAVDAALRLLALCLPGPLPFAEVSLLLRSPHLAGAVAEADARARAELALREVGRADWHLEAVLHQAGRHAPGFAQALAAMRDALDLAPRGDGPRRTPGEWTARLGVALDAAGWPGDGPLDSAGHQAVAAFHELLADLARLDAVGGPRPFPVLLAELGRAARERVFQPAGGGAPVEVLGLLEASGQTFDRLWVCGLDEAAWPPPARPNPLLPVHLRRAHGLPHASPEREAAVAARLTRNFAAAADAVVFSHAARDGDAELAPSPLTASLPELPASTLVPTLAPRAVDLAGSVQAERYVDAYAPPVPAGTLGGGSARVADQSACPFRAFARHRLGVEPLGPPPRGLDALTRGRLVHAVLQTLWRDEGVAIARLEPARRHARVTLACARALDAVEAQLGDRPRLRRIEQDRLVDLVEAWLDVDAALPPGREAEVEKGVEHRFGDHVLRLRPDRVDRLPDGRVAVVDYKTARTLRPGDWDAPRPAAPQFPLYAAALGPERVAALAFARVHVEGCRYVGLATGDGMLPGVVATGEASERIAAAAAAATSLLDEHLGGRAAVDPQPGACTFCGLEPLCRVHELDTADEVDHAEEGDDG